MKALWKATLLAGAAFGAFSTPVFAQDAAPGEDASAVEEVVVTARRTEESLQDVPGSVSAFSARTLERIQAADTTGLQGAVPNMNIVAGRGSSNATNIYIRGVGQPDALQTFDPAIGVYIDDVYLSRIRGTQMNLFDLERVEVLRGPQGTLYGKNTIGGAMKLVTRRPGQELRALGQVTVGSYEQFDAKASVSGPISDTVAMSFDALTLNHAGYVKDPVLNREYNDQNTLALRTRLAFDPSDRLRLDVIADYSRDDAAMTVGQPTSTLTTLFGGPLLTLPATPPTYNFETRTTASLPNSTKLQSWGVSAIAAYDISDALTLKSITAYRSLATDDYIDIDASQLELGDVFVGVDQNQTSQEFQLNYEGEALTLVSGLYFLKENITSHQEAYADDLIGPLFGNPTFLRTIDDDLETTSWAAYVNATYELTDRLSVSAGLRYTDEEKAYFRTTSTFSSNPIFSADPAFAFPGKLKESWSDISPMVSADFDLTENAMLYARASKGFKSGGFNGRANNPGEQAPYDPETVVSYEVGAKTDWADNRFRVNFALFQNDYKDFQARVSGTVTDPITGLPTPELTVLNAGAMTISGAELEFSASPVRNLLLDAQMGYLHAEYDEFDDVRFTSFGGSRAFQTPAFAPEWTMRFGGQYAWELGSSGKLTIGGQARFRGNHALAVDNTAVNSAAPLPGLWQDDYWVYDARALWESADGRFSAGLYGKNLSDEVYRTDGQEFSSIGNIRTAYYGAPRTVSFTVTARY